jgi:hypothetical protein
VVEKYRSNYPGYNIEKKAYNMINCRRIPLEIFLIITYITMQSLDELCDAHSILNLHILTVSNKNKASSGNRWSFPPTS